MDFNQSWVIDATWEPSFVDEVKGQILKIAQGNRKESGTGINREPTVLRDRRGKPLNSIGFLSTETS